LASVLWFHGGVYNVPQALSRDQAETKVLQELGQQDTSFNHRKLLADAIPWPNREWHEGT
jgi:hypothetical protein